MSKRYSEEIKRVNKKFIKRLKTLNGLPNKKSMKSLYFKIPDCNYKFLNLKL